MLKTAPLPTKLEKKIPGASQWVDCGHWNHSQQELYLQVCWLEQVLQQQMIYLRHFVQNV